MSSLTQLQKYTIMVKEKSTEAKSKKASTKATMANKKKTTIPKGVVVKKKSVPSQPRVKKDQAVKNGSNSHPAEATLFPRMNETDLAFFKDLLEKKEKLQKAELESINDSLNSNNEHGGFSEDGSSVSNEKEQLNQRKSKIIQTLHHIENAYARIRNKTYGRCKTTHKLIDPARLKVVPWATESIEAKLQRQK